MTGNKDWKYKEPIFAIYFKPDDVDTNTFDELIGKLVYVREFHEDSRGYEFFHKYYNIVRCPHNDQYRCLREHYPYRENQMLVGKILFETPNNHSLGKKTLDRTDR